MGKRILYTILLGCLFPNLNLQAQENNASASPGQSIKFNRISVEEGLSQNTVNCIFQDHQGFMWFGTQDGLNIYDGSKFKVYKTDPNDPGSLSENYVNSITEDRSGVLWVGTNAGGLNKFDRSHERFIHYYHDPGNPQCSTHCYYRFSNIQ